MLEFVDSDLYFVQDKNNVITPLLLQVGSGGAKITGPDRIRIWILIPAPNAIIKHYIYFYHLSEHYSNESLKSPMHERVKSDLKQLMVSHCRCVEVPVRKNGEQANVSRKKAIFHNIGMILLLSKGSRKKVIILVVWPLRYSLTPPPPPRVVTKFII